MRHVISLSVLLIAVAATLRASMVQGSTALSLVTFIVLTLTILVPLIAIIKQALERDSIDILNPVIYLPLAFGIFFGSGSSVLIDENRVEDARKLLFFLLMGIAGYYVGVAIWKAAVGDSSRTVYRAQARQEVPTVVSTQIILIVFGLGFIAMLVYLAKAGGIPLLMPDVENARIRALTGAGLPFQVSLLMMVAVWLGFGTNNSLTTPARVALLLTGTVMLSLSGWRNTPLALIAVTLLIVHYRKPIPTRWMLGTITVLLLGAVSIGLYREQSSGLKNYRTYQLIADGHNLEAASVYLQSYTATFSRNLVDVIALVPDKISYQFGATYFWNFLTLAPGINLRPFDFILKEAAGQGFAGGGLPPTLVGELFLNFGFIGVPLGMVVIGIGASVLHSRLTLNGDIQRIVCAMILYYLFSAVRGGLGNVALTAVWLTFCVIAVTKFGRASERGRLRSRSKINAA